MKRDLLIHFIYMLSLFILIAVYKKWFDPSYLPFLFGGIVGTLLPDVDHLIYIYFLKPGDLVSREVMGLLAKRDFFRSWDLLSESRTIRGELIFHSAFFQILFLLFAFLIVTSSGSLLGRGVVLAFSLHLLIDQVVDYIEAKDIRHWFTKLPFQPDTEQGILFMGGYLVLLLIIGFFF